MCKTLNTCPASANKTSCSAVFKLKQKLNTCPASANKTSCSAVFQLKQKLTKIAPRKVYKYHKAHMMQLNDFVHDKLHQYMIHTFNSSDVEANWTHFKETILQAIKSFVPHTFQSGKFHLPWITPAIRRMIRQRDRIYKKSKENKKNSFRKKIELKRKEIQKEINKSYWNYVNNLIDFDCNATDFQTNIRSKTKNFWKYIKAKRQERWSANSSLSGESVIAR